jgi:hypothetical protein
MCKFTNKDGKGYKSVVAVIKKLAAMETAQGVPKVCLIIPGSIYFKAERWLGRYDQYLE